MLSEEKNRNIQSMVDDLHQHTLAAISSQFGKLVYLASLRDDNSGQYHHCGLEQLYPREECHQALLLSHRLVFYEWLRMTLAEQRVALLSHLNELGEDPPTVLKMWRKLEPFRLYPPTETSGGDRELFFSDLRVLLELLLKAEVAS